MFSLILGNSEFMSELDAGDQQVMNTIQQFLRNMPSSGGGGNSDVKFNKKLLDFDYSDDEDGGGGVDFSEPTPQMLDALSNILGNDRLLGKLKVNIDCFLDSGFIFFSQKFVIIG